MVEYKKKYFGFWTFLNSVLCAGLDLKGWKGTHLIVRANNRLVSCQNEVSDAIYRRPVKVSPIFAMLDEFSGGNIRFHLLPGFKEIIFPVHFTRSTCSGSV